MRLGRIRSSHFGQMTITILTFLLLAPARNPLIAALRTRFTGATRMVLPSWGHLAIVATARAAVKLG